MNTSCPSDEIRNAADAWKRRYFCHTVPAFRLQQVYANLGIANMVPVRSLKTFTLAYRFDGKKMIPHHAVSYTARSESRYFALPEQAARQLTSEADLAEMTAEAIRWGQIYDERPHLIAKGETCKPQ